MIERNLIALHEEPSSFYYFYIDKEIVDRIIHGERDFNKWFQSSVNLCLLMEKGKIYQEIGKDKSKMKLFMDDLIAYPKSSEKSYAVNISPELVNEIYKLTGKGKRGEIDIWMRKALYFANVMENMELFNKDESDEFIKIDFK